MHTCSKNRLILLLLALLAVAFLPADRAVGADDPPRRESTYVNMATWYRVDPDWPQRPAGVEWGQTAGVAVDAEDQIWVHTRANPPVQVYTPDGKYVRGWGEGIIGSAHYLKIGPEGNIWMADVKDHVVRQFTPQGRLLKTLGTPGEAGDDDHHLNKPTDMAITPDGQVFVSDGYGNSRVVHFDENGRFVKAWGSAGTGPGQFNLVHGIVVDSKGRLYVADRSNARIQVFDQSGRFIEQWRNLLVPWGLSITKDDEIWACGSSPMAWEEADGMLGCPPKDQLFMRLSTSGKLLQIWLVPKGEDGQEKPGEVNWVHAMDLDSNGNIYAGDIQGQKVQKFVRQN